MNDRDCESCKKFSRNDPHESEGYCEAKRTWVDPQEGEDCKMHEFTLHSATKYKDGTPIMSEPEKVYCDTDSALIHGESNQVDIHFCGENSCPYWKTCLQTLSDKHICPFLPHDTDSNLRYLEQAFTEFAKVQDDLIAEYDAISSDVEDLQRKVYQIYQFLNSVDPDFFAKIEEQMHSEPPKHNCNNFCGNCAHAEMEDGICACELSGEVVDPDDSSCSMFEPPF